MMKSILVSEMISGLQKSIIYDIIVYNN